MKAEEGSKKVGLKLNIQKMKIMASSPITSWQIDGGTKSLQMVHCSHKIKRCLLLGRKAMMNLDRVLKSRDITLLTKVHIIKAMIFLVFMYRCEDRTIKKTEHQIIDAFELWCWRRLLRVLWTLRRSNQSILKEINPEYSLEGLILKLKLQYFGHLVGRANSVEKTLVLGKIEGRKRKGQQRWDSWMTPLTQWTWIWATSWRQWRTGKLACCSPWGHKGSDTTEWLNWTEHRQK